MDQGHATQSLTTTWGLLAASMVSTEAMQRHWAALAWKLTMLRCHDGGFCQNPYTLEYQGGEGLLPNYLRSGAYLVILNSTKRNLAITGAPQWRAKQLVDVPPVCHQDAVALGYYQRNWGVADAVLGTKAPQRLREGLAKLQAMGKGNNTHGELYDFLKAEAAPTAREILRLKDIPSPEQQYLAEMVLGVDLRVTAELALADGKEKSDVGRWEVSLDVQHPLAGYFSGAAPDEREAWRKNPPLPLKGQVTIDSNPPIQFAIQPDCGNHDWQTNHLSESLEGPAQGPLHWVAHINYQVGDMIFQYTRPIVAGGDEPGNGEKGRKVLNDRIVGVRGQLQRDLNGWNGSFYLPGGQYISAATQGLAAQVAYGNRLKWIAAEDGVVPAGTECEFGFTSGWQPVEARIAAIRVVGRLPVLRLSQLTVQGAPVDRDPLQDFDHRTGVKVAWPVEEQVPLEIEAELPAEATVRGIDLRLSDQSRQRRVTVETQVDGRWKIVFQGQPDRQLSAFPPTRTRRVRVRLVQLDPRAKKGTELQEFHLIRPGDSPSQP